MKTVVLLIFALCLLPFALLSAQTPPQQPPPVFRGGVDVFQLEVTVLDRQRQPVRGLTASDFSVLEDGKPRALVNFSEVELPQREGPPLESQEDNAPDVQMARYADRRLFAIVMDDWGMPSLPTESPFAIQLASEAKAIAKKIVDSLGPLDFAAIVLSRDTRYFPDFSNNVWKLYGAINEFRPLPRDSGERLALEMMTNGHIGGLPALQDVTDYLSKLPQHRKSIIYISTGQQVRFNGSVSGDRAIDLFKAAKQLGIPISPIDPTAAVAPGGGASTFLLTLAENTGGLPVLSPNALAGLNGNVNGIQQIFLESGSYYLLGYQRTGPSDGRYRQLEVRVNRPGVEVHSRTGYFAPGKPDMVKAPPPPFDELTDQAIRGLSKDDDSRRLYTYASARPGALTVAAEIGQTESGRPAWTRGADVQVTVTRNGTTVATGQGQIEAGARGTIIDIPVTEPLPSAGASAAPLHASVKVSAGTDRLDDGADAIAAGALVGAPIVFRAPSLPRAVSRPVAEFEFSRTERVHVDWPVLKPAEQRKARILRRTGEALPFEPPLTDREVNGRPVISTDFSLSALAPGEYVVELVAQSGTVADRRVVAFRIR
jgi:VWFA-related protein